MEYDFSGWATKNDLKCADGKIIRKGAFKVNDGKKVPLVWGHVHDRVSSVLGHAILENRDEGVYAYCKFNATQAGKDGKECVKHGDIESLSIWANNVEQVGDDVIHGVIREVSLVMAGANPGAFIESVVSHGEPMEPFDEEGLFYTGESIILEHSIDNITNSEDQEGNTNEEVKDSKENKIKKEDNIMEHSADNITEHSADNIIEHADEKDTEEKSEKTVGDVLETLTDEQKAAVGILIDEVTKENSNKEEDKEMKHDLFDTENVKSGAVISHDDMQKIFSDAKRLGSLRDAVNENFEDGGVLAHSIPMDGMDGPSPSTASQTYGFRDPDMLFPEYKTVNGNTPEWISRNMDWVQKVISGVHHSPFSRIKSVYADITEDAARAKGYIKGNLKKDEVFTLLKRTTDPQTIYKKQKMDRDDLIDIVDFDVVAWIKSEMRVMLNEEIARAILIGDGRLTSDDDKIREEHVRPIVTDVDLFNVKVPITVAGAKAVINGVIRARKNYKGSGNPTFFTTEDELVEMLLLEDGIGHKLYKTEAELATALRVKEIVTVEAMEGYKVKVNNNQYDLIGVIVNLNDYNVGADKGGEINMFDDFDIDYNQQKYLIETRISGALIKPFSALTVYRNVGGTSMLPQG